MPLTEFIRMSKGRVDATQHRASISSDPSSRPETDFVELVWENGQITMQGQPNRERKGPISNNCQTLASKPQEVRNASSSKMVKLSMDDSMAADHTLPVPYYEMGLDHDVDIVPWLNYPIEESLHNEYASDFLRELSGVTFNDLSTENHLASLEKKSSFQGNRHSIAVDNAISLKQGNPSKAPSSVEKHRLGESSEVPQFSPPFQQNIPTSGISDITRINNVISHQITSLDTIQNPSSLRAFSSSRLQKFDAGQPSTSSGFTNFPCISQRTALARANHLNIKSSNILENDEKKNALSSNNAADSTLVNPRIGGSQKGMVSQNQSVRPSIQGNSESFPAKPIEEVFSSNQVKCGENDTLQNTAHCATLPKPGIVGESDNMGPMVAASSVCSGNSVERASNEPSRDSKSKSRETESEGPSEEVEEESVGARKTPPTRTGLKRTRAAEVHNLSERRRRDRINEKMRALQELIPNCNKVDKASMLDEAIEYLKTLQLQVQMLSVGNGLYMQPMMFPSGMQTIQGAHMPHFSPMGIGMGMGMGFGFNMLDMNSGMKVMPFQGPHYPIPSAGLAFPGVPSSSLQAFGHPGQGFPMPVHRPPLLPTSAAPLNMPLGINISGVAASTIAAPLAPSICSKNGGQQMLRSNNVEISMNQAPNQAASEGIGNRPPSHDQTQPGNASEAAVPSSGTDGIPT